MKYVAFIILFLFSCADKGQNQHSPLSLVERYIRAVERNDAEAIYRLLSREVKERLSKELIKEGMKDFRVEISKQLSALKKRVKAEDLKPYVDIVLADGEVVTLVFEDGEWRVAGGLFESYSLRSPRAVISALYKALLRRDYFLFFSLLSTEKQRELETEINFLLERIKRIDSLPIVIEGDRAVIEYAPNHFIELIREGEEWRIEDIK